VTSKGMELPAFSRRFDRNGFECVIPKNEFDLQDGDMDDPEQHPVAIALRRERGIDDARVSKRELLIRRGERRFRYGAPKRVS
jgi:hypothetical protein